MRDSQLNKAHGLKYHGLKPVAERRGRRTSLRDANAVGRTHLLSRRDIQPKAPQPRISNPWASIRGPLAPWLLVLLLTLLALPGHAAAPLRVAAAANLQQVFTEALLPAFTKKTGITVTPTYGATKVLALQVENGAPIDVFVGADTETVQKLASDRLVIASTVQPYAIGQLVVWSRRDAARHPATLADLASPAYAYIAYANPKTAPYGLAAEQAFARAGLTASVTPRLVQAGNIGEALQFAQSGNADVALTALSLVIQDKTDPYFIVPDKLHDPITQSLGLVRTTTQTTQALDFIRFITGKDAAKIWKRYGYALPKKR